MMSLTRRRFFRRSVVHAAGIASIPMILSATLPEKKEKKKDRFSIFPGDGTVLFQGDSITDAGRNKERQLPNDASSFGNGYALMAGASLLEKLAGKTLTIYNRGISGNKVYQLRDRWNEDCLDLQPDVLSILIGVNDYWHKRNGNYDGTPEVYETDLRALLKQTKEALPNVRLVICEPFSVPGGTAIGEGWMDEFAPYQKAAKKLAEEFDTFYVPYQQIFEEALKHAPAAYWSPDGVHPSMAGAQLMASAWLKVVK
ncbi:SGNH/GDSL hydrolase family protein [uncultured Sunxiuqinia sp.]|jgi:lysophospholipase L1-like esterase|uniref:SGNH/GDSL hydrolase family protein n=1 Tax=uncultured Sunxiuqinia sp. TaxID=1573825 RepID=UPI0030D70C11|tara:strand:- start:36364 stop:37131 length:768 start_codon:yes stop_codon:yes gene_type:complete